LLSIPIYLADLRSSVLILAIQYLMTDSLIAFKSCYLTCFGIFALSIMNLVYKDGRPFWNEKTIESMGHCTFNFGSPDQCAFTLTFYWGYAFAMHRLKFAKDPNKFVTGVVFAILVCMSLLLYLSGVALGITYIY
jgi:hypothetical protein